MLSRFRIAFIGFDCAFLSMDSTPRRTRGRCALPPAPAPPWPVSSAEELPPGRRARPWVALELMRCSATEARLSGGMWGLAGARWC